MGKKLVDLVTGIVAAVVVFVAVPVVLVALVGLPAPHHWDRADVLSSHGLFDLLAIMAWVAWMACCWPLLRSVVSRVRRRDATTTAGARLPEWLATRIAAAVLVVVPVGLALGSVAGASGNAHSPATYATPYRHGTPTPHSALSTHAALAPHDSPTPTRTDAPAATIDDVGSTPDASAAQDGPVPSQYTVVTGDSLWSIAERFYGDGGEWSAIAQANLGRVMVDGTRFLDPSLIHPGWVLLLPQSGAGLPSSPAPGPAVTAGPTAPAAAASATGTSATGAGMAVTGTGTAAISFKQPVAVHADKRTAPRTAAAHHRSGTRHTNGAHDPTTDPTIQRTSRTGAGTDSHHTRSDGTTPSQPPGSVPLPELTALGVGVLVAAALARRARKARHLASLARREGQPPAVVSELAADTDTLVSPFEGAPVLDWLETANRHLTGALGQMGRTADAPVVQLVRVGPDGVEMRLTEPVSWAPGHWVLQGGQAWHLSSSLRLEMVVTEARGHQPWLPSLIPIGENDEGTWLVPVEPGCCLPVIGAGADALVSAMRVAAESWTWSEQVVVTDDVIVAEHASALADRSADSLDRPRVLFVGDPGALSAGARARCGVITTLPLPATDVTVAVDAKAASLHPLGVTLRPHLLDRARSASVAELVRTPGPQPVADPDGPDGPDHGPASDEIEVPAARIAALPHAAVSQRRPHEPGPIEVRLLTAVPRIDGLADELPPKRARRATELVAYLALHHPDPVTSDRLRTRVLGSADADAAAKTLFNTVGAGRRAMGRDPSGELYLPPATKSGQYRVSPLVTVDVTRATALVAAADAATDVDMSIALLREALGLVEGEPLAGTLTGYAWWGAEGHERRISTELVDGACRLARLAAGSGYLDLARWAVEQARLVEPYSEALSRVAMEVAAKTGDAGRLRREWVECQRRVDELDPGSLPSESTERLYAELRRQVPA